MKSRWTPEEVKLFDAGFTNKEIAEMTGRTIKAVQMKRYNMSFKSSTPDSTTPGDLMAQETKEWRILTLCKKLGVKLFG